MRNKESKNLRYARYGSSAFSLFIPVFLLFIILTSCSPFKKISSLGTGLVNDPSLQTAHVGISIYEPGTGKYWYDHNGSKYFVPASNTKIPVCYAAMKYLGDSLAGIKYAFSEGADTTRLLCIQPTGDPSFLHPQFKEQRVYKFLKQHTGAAGIGILDTAWKAGAWGDGWSWNDYNSYYMAERNSFPIYGNRIRFTQVKEIKYDGRYTKSNFVYTEPDIGWEINFGMDTSNKVFYVQRDQWRNIFNVHEGEEDYKEVDVPFVTNGTQSALELLKDTLFTDFTGLTRQRRQGNNLVYQTITDERPKTIRVQAWETLYSQPTDSVLRPMMHQSDNFFAEQLLLMVANERLGVMSDERIIDTLLGTDLKDMPQQPRWADGSGLSRYNLFSPNDMIAILGKMNEEFGMERIRVIFPTGGEGTLGNYFGDDKGYIYAKTGSLSGVVALSGYLYTRKNKLLLFSVLVNNHQASASTIRQAIEKFLVSIRNDN